MSKYRNYVSSEKEGRYKSIIAHELASDSQVEFLEDEEYLADYSFIQSEFSCMLGRVLTIIDASIAETKQNKAVKDIIRNEFVDEYVHLGNILLDQKEINKQTNEYADSVDIASLGEVTLEEVAGA